MTGGYLWGRTELEGLDVDAGSSMVIEFQNDSLWLGGTSEGSHPCRN